MEADYPGFVTVLVRPGKKVRVEVPEGNVWDISTVSIAINDQLPPQGRVVLYAGIVDASGKVGEKVAIAPLRIAQCEVINVNLSVNCVTPIEFVTTGDAISVNVSGNVSANIPLVVTEI